jgi:predicted RNA binding protein YcfA (HicA-like mRNA interferase family)
MGIKVIPVGRFISWLESKGLILIRISGSHHMYNYPPRYPQKLVRNIVVTPKIKDIPITHIHTNLRTIGISKEQFEMEIKNF